MPAILVVGPSRAGKSTLTSRLEDAQTVFVTKPVRVVNLDVELGTAHRSDGVRAIEIILCLSREACAYIVDCGSGQVVFSGEFREFLLQHREAVIVVWCDEPTFRARRSDAGIARELTNNYGPEVSAIWDVGRTLGHLVDTSADRGIDVVLTELRSVIQNMLAREQWIAANSACSRPRPMKS